jgi:glycogen(starch) synthase
MSEADKTPLRAEPHEPKTPTAGHPGEPLLCEVAWEVCQQLGGIYTVLRSKVPSMVQRWGRNYCLIGPYNPQASPLEFEESPPTGPFGQVVKNLAQAGFEVHHGHWLITGRPRVVLFNPASVFRELATIKYRFWEHHDIGTLNNDSLVDQVLAFGHMVETFLRLLAEQQSYRRPIIAHFHEWMAGSAVPELRRLKIPVATVFTTHATLLGRYLAMNDPWFCDHLPFVDWLGDARRFNIEPQIKLERAAAHGSHVFTTLSDITALECEHLLGRKPDILLPNGLNIERFVALHEFQNLHRVYKERIHQFVMGHFFPSYTFDLDHTLYFFTSGRYEYRNKGFDLAIEAMARLNWRLKQADSRRTVVFFIVTRGAFRSINAEVLRSRAEMEEIRKTCEAIKNQAGDRLFVATAMGQSPSLDELVDDYWRLRLRRMRYAWKAHRLPPIVTHDLTDDGTDAVLNELRRCQLANRPEDPVKVVYHPDFIMSSNPLFGVDYDQFVRGCHLGVFPSAYEPWGYAPLECAALGIPSVTTDLAGFGSYLLRNMPNHRQQGLAVLHRRFASFDAAADELAGILLDFAQMERRERIALRNLVESSAEQFDWHNLGRHYDEAHRMAVKAVG